jgi:hypothetical protein
MNRQRLEEVYRAQDEIREVLKKYNVDLVWDYDGLTLEPCEGKYGIEWGAQRGDKTPRQKHLEQLRKSLTDDLEKVKSGESVWHKVPGKDPKSYRPDGLTVEDLQGWLDKIRQELSSES